MHHVCSPSFEQVLATLSSLRQAEGGNTECLRVSSPGRACRELGGRGRVAAIAASATTYAAFRATLSQQANNRCQPAGSPYSFHGKVRALH